MQLSTRVSLVLLVLVSVLGTPATATAQTGSDLSVVGDAEAPSNGEISVRLSEETLPSAARVVISRDDEFADALASGVMQATSPLLLVPSGGPIPDRVAAEIQRLGAEDAVILGGTGAVTPAVETELAALGVTVGRLEGGSRIETAVEIARSEAPAASTAILARAFSADPNNPTQGFADALGAGAVSARNSWPILLTATETLSAATEQYLRGSAITDVQIVGGVLAVSQGVETQLQQMGITTTRIAGDSRGETALEIAKTTGADSAADVAHVVLVDGTSPDGWAGGFAAANRAAALDAPVLLADGVRLLPETIEFLEPGTAFAQAGELTITCVVHPLACTEGRQALGLVDVPVLTLDPPRNTLVEPGQAITAILSPTSVGAGVEVGADGTCLGEFIFGTTDAAGRITLTLPTSLPTPDCQITFTYGSDDAQSFNRSTVAYTTDPTAPSRGADQAFVASEVLAFGSVVPTQPVFVNDQIACTTPAGVTATSAFFAMQAQHQQPDLASLNTINLGSAPVTTTPDAACEISITPPPEASRVFWGLYVFSDGSLRQPLLLGTGTTAAFDLAAVARDTGIDTRDVSVRWVIQIDDPTPSAPQPPPDGPPGIINNPDGLPVVCDGQLVPPGFSQQRVGASCTIDVSSIDGIAALVAQPDMPNRFGQTVAFQPLAESRFTTARLALLADGSGQPTPPPSSCAATTPLTLSAPASGEVVQPGQVRTYAIDLSAGQAVRIRAEAEDATFDPVLTVLDPAGAVRGMNDDESSATIDSRVDLVADVTGTHCVQVAGFDTSTGDFRLTVDPAPSFVDAGTLTADQPFFTYDLAGARGDRFIIELRRDGDAGGLDPVLEVYDADGRLVASDDDGGGFPNARIDLTLPTAGEFVVVATAFDGRYGGYTIEGSFPATGFASSAAAPTSSSWGRTGDTG